MASLFEQYEQASSLSSNYMTGKPSKPEMITAGLINANLEDDAPMFSKKRIDFSPSDCITQMAICNQKLVLGMRSKLRKMDLSSPDVFDDFDLQKIAGERAKIHDLFVNRSGQHILVSLVSPESENPLENLYFTHSSKKVQHCSKMKGHVISAVAWNPLIVNDNTTSCILIGTTKGLIFETELALGDERTFLKSSSPEQYWKQVFDVSSSNMLDTDSKGITGLTFQKSLGDSYFIIATTPRRLCHFVGHLNSDPPMLQNVFNCYQDIPEAYIELPGKLPYSKLQLFYPPSKMLPVSFAWMTEPGVYYANINYSAESVQKIIGTDARLLSYPDDKNERKNPLSIVVTEFHVLVLFPDRLKVMCVLNEQQVFEDVFSESYGTLKGMVKDEEKNVIWVYSDMAIYRYRLIRENRHIWEVYLNKNEYVLAKKFCEGDPVKIDKVLSKQAENFFKSEKYEDSAVIYAQTHTSFEEIALKFLEARKENALRKFLLKKLEGLKSQDKTQITMLVMWLMEIYLNELGVLRTAERQNSEEFVRLQKEFRSLLNDSRIKECASNNRSAVYSLMSSHGDEENLIYFTNLMKDFEKVIQYHLQHKNYRGALSVLAEHSRPELFYQFSPALMQTNPKETVDAWIAQNGKLKPVQLIPALAQYDSSKDPRQGSEAIRYLEYCVEKMRVQDQAIHNYLITLYARMHEMDKLMVYLQQSESDAPYDQKYALRICSELEGLEQACVHIYTTMGLYEEAVDLALKVDIELAKQNANRPEDNEDLRKKLWLKIAKHVVKEKNDIKRAMEFLQQCDLIKVEDILPFFPDFVTIDHFKDAICSSLQSYNQHIEGLKEEMEIATQSTQEIRAEIQTFRNKYSMVVAQEKCASCSYPIMGQSFYHFPCKHILHSICLIAEVQPYLTVKKQGRISEIQRQLAALMGQEDSGSISSASLISTSVSAKDKLNAELDDLVASECIYCGDIMIRSIDTPFLDMSDYESISQSWE